MSRGKRRLFSVGMFVVIAVIFSAIVLIKCLYISNLVGEMEGNKTVTEEDKNELEANARKSSKIDVAKTIEEADFSFSVISDIHIDEKYGVADENFINALQDLNKVNPKSKVMLVAGDITNSGRSVQYDRYKEILEKYPHPQVYHAIGNHEFFSDNEGKNLQENKTVLNRFKNKLGAASSYLDGAVEGYHFITLGPINFQGIRFNNEIYFTKAVITKAQLNQLDKGLENAAKGNKPTFVFMHLPIAKTIYDSDYGKEYINGDKLIEILSKYSNVVVFTGHTHCDLNIALSKCKSSFKCFNTGATYNIYDRRDVKIDKNMSQGLVVTIKNGKVRVSARDFINHRWIETSD